MFGASDTTSATLAGSCFGFLFLLRSELFTGRRRRRQASDGVLPAAPADEYRMDAGRVRPPFPWNISRSWNP